MHRNLLRAIALVLVGTAASGCSVLKTTNHASAFNYLDIKSSASDHHYPRADERGSLHFPKSDHVSLKGNKSKVFLASGQEHFKRQNYGLAAENFLKAVEHRTDSPAAWLGLAASLDQLGNFSQADTAYRQVSELRSGNARVLNNWGYSYLLRGNYQKARQYFSQAQNIDPTLEEIQGNIHLLEKTIDG